MECELIKNIKSSLPNIKEKEELNKIEKFIDNLKEKYSMTYNENGKLIKTHELDELHNSVERQAIGMMKNTLDINKLDEQLEEYRESIHAKKCPGCGSIVERRDGCM